MTALPRNAVGEVPPRHPSVRGAFPEPEKRGPLSVFVSLCLHILLIWLLVMMTAIVASPEVTKELVTYLSPKLIPGGGGGGGNAGVVPLDKPKPPPEEKAKPVIPPPPPPVEIPVVVPPVTPPPPTATATTAAAPGTVSSGTGGGIGGGNGKGEGTGNGIGKGPGDGAGTGGGIGEGGKKETDAQSRFLIIPPFDGLPKDLHGKEINVSFHVLVSGIVDTVIADPFIKDKKYAKTFNDVMKGYRWEPARDSTGKKIAKWATMQITFP